MALVSNNDKFVFVHIPKNAGTSITESLGDYGKRHKCNLHLQAEHLRDIIPTYNKMFSFAFVRNPWARLLSLYTYTRRKWNETGKAGKAWKIVGGLPTNVDFNTWLLETEFYTPGNHPLFGPAIPHQRRSQLDWITDKDRNIIVDVVGKVENIDEDFGYICDQIGINRPVLPTTNTTNHGHYVEEYSKEAIEFVAEHFKEDIDMFGYKFGK